MAVLCVTALLLAGCSSAPSGPIVIARAQVLAYVDDVDCDNMLDVVGIVSGAPANNDTHVRFGGTLDAHLLQKLPAGTVLGVQDWHFDVQPIQFSPDDAIEWIINGSALKPGMDYRLTAQIHVDHGGTFANQTDFSFGRLAVARAQSC